MARERDVVKGTVQPPKYVWLVWNPVTDDWVVKASQEAAESSMEWEGDRVVRYKVSEGG